MPFIVDIPVEFLGAPYLFTLIRSIKFVPVSNHDSGRFIESVPFFHWSEHRMKRKLNSFVQKSIEVITEPEHLQRHEFTRHK